MVCNMGHSPLGSCWLARHWPAPLLLVALSLAVPIRIVPGVAEHEITSLRSEQGASNDVRARATPQKKQDPLARLARIVAPMKLDELLAVPSVNTALNKLDEVDKADTTGVAARVEALAGAIVAELEKHGIAADEEESAFATRLLTALLLEVKRDS